MNKIYIKNTLFETFFADSTIVYKTVTVTENTAGVIMIVLAIVLIIGTASVVVFLKFRTGIWFFTTLGFMLTIIH